LLFNRIWAAIKRESLYVVAQGVAGAAEVDGIMKDVLGMNRGVFEMLDSVGLDVALDIETHYAHVRPGQIPSEPAALLKSMVDAGTLGVKSGKGFYEHPPHAPIAEKDHIVFLDVIKGEVRSLAIDGREGKTLVSELTSRPDGVQIDERPGKGRYRLPCLIFPAHDFQVTSTGPTWAPTPTMASSAAPTSTDPT
jgi:3-hydroxyacyl-CoA dehydrogenase